MIAAESALYYPYIHVRDQNWLKSSLLLFDQIHRMVPSQGDIRGDESWVGEYSRPNSDGKVLLGPANIWSPRAEDAQIDLAGRLRESAADPAFRARFGEAATASTKTDPYGFQIHQDKLHETLKDALRQTRLAWPPDPRFRDGPTYVEVNPRVGQAVMSTIAIACAKDDGLAIVTDQGSESLHQCLVEKNQEAVYDAWLGERERLSEPRTPEAHELFEYVITLHFDTSTVDAGRLAEMRSAPTALRDLVGRLGDHAAKIPAMSPGPRRKKRIEDEVAAIISEWEGDKASLEAFGKEFVGEGLANAGAKFLEKVAEKSLAGGAAGGAGAAIAGTVGIIPIAVGASIGLGVGLVVHAGKSFAAIRRRQALSPYRYLTAIEKAGAVFRSDALSTTEKPEPAQE